MLVGNFMESIDKQVLYVYDKLSNTNVPERIRDKVNLLFDIDCQSIELFRIKQIFCNVKRLYHADIVHTHHTKSAFFLSVFILTLRLLRIKNIKRIHTAHRDISLLSLISRAIYRYVVFPVSDFIICNSEATKFVIMNFTNNARIQTIYNGVDTDRFFVSDGLARSNTLKVITVGRLISVKNHEVIIRAISDCLLEGVDVELAIIGDGPERFRLQALIENLDVSASVSLLGNIKHQDVPMYLQGYDVYVASSWSEGFGNATIEAGLCGLAVLASNIPVHREIGGGNFSLFDPYSHNELKSQLICHQESRSPLSVSESAQYFHKFSEQICVSKHHKLYMDLLNENNNTV